jgi:hypothetical protein
MQHAALCGPTVFFWFWLQDMQQQQLSTKQREVLNIMQQNQFKAQSVEDEQLLARARSLMPLDSWRTAAQEQHELNRQLEPGTPTTAVDDLIVKSMLRWFKQDFFSWVRPAFRRAGESVHFPSNIFAGRKALASLNSCYWADWHHHMRLKRSAHKACLG